jgi:NTP pyrophosphatase (non-canonical NTP hydrolase)
MSMNADQRAQANEILEGYSNWVHDAAFYAQHHTDSILEWSYVASGLVSEAGEVVAEVQKIMGSASSREALQGNIDARLPKILDECSDVMWYLMRLCNLLRIEIHELMIYNLVKLHHRYNCSEPDQTGEEKWPLKNLSYQDALRLTQRIAFRIMEVNASIYMGTATSLKL